MSGRYEIGPEIGRGATSVVHRGRDLRLGRDVAIKVLRADHGHDPAFLARFRRQAANAALLNHPGIVAVYDTGELPRDGNAGGEPFIVMELIDGRTLRAELDADGVPTTTRAVGIVMDICAALDFSHRHGIVHRSVCPENVMLENSGPGKGTKSTVNGFDKSVNGFDRRGDNGLGKDAGKGAGTVKLMDFGIPRPSTADEDDSGSVRSTQVAGYLSPEQARGEPVDARSDVYGTGCLLYELLTGAPPFTGDDPVAIAYRQVGEPVRPPSELAATVPVDLDAIVLKALEKDPLDRYQSAADLRSDLSRVLVGAPALAATASVVDGASPPWTGGHRPAGVSPPLLAPPTRSRPTDDGEQPSPRRSRRVASFVGFGIICVVALAAAVWLTMGVITAPPPARPIAVPDLSGMTLDEARQALSDKGLAVGTVTEQDSSRDQTGRVLQQRPSGQTEVAGHTPVNLVVGRGVSVVNVPDLAGMRSDQARQALSALGLTYTEQNQPSSDADKGKVVAQTPAAHQPAAPGSTVTATVGTGLTMVAVPDGLVGVSVDDATAVLAGAGLTAVGVEQDGTEPAGVVIDTDHGPGQQVPEGSPITLKYSNNALMVMPNLVGRGRDSAAAVLQDQGWAGDAGTLSTTSAATSSANLIGAVVTQQPAAGTVVPKLGTPVAVGIGVRQITMPALVGKSRAAAESALKAAGATQVTFADGGTGPRGQSGKVASQNVPGGTAIAADTPIVVVVYD